MKKNNKINLQQQKHMATKKKCQAIPTRLQRAHSLLPNLSLSIRKLLKTILFTILSSWYFN